VQIRARRFLHCAFLVAAQRGLCALVDGGLLQPFGFKLERFDPGTEYFDPLTIAGGAAFK